MERVAFLIEIFFINVSNVLQQSALQFINFLTQRQRRLIEVVLLHLLQTTPPNHLLDLGPILRLSRERSVWMKERSNDWWNRIVTNHFEDEDWLETFRMTKVTFLWLCDELREDLSPNMNQLGTREPLTVEKQVAVCLYFLASCEYRVTANNFGIHKSTVWKCVHRVIEAITKNLMSGWITMPDDDECKRIATAFERKSNIPQIIGAIDGTHIPILPPSDGYRDYINRKGWPSTILQAVVDNDYRFRNIYCGSPGASLDAGVFRNSQLFRNNDSLIPKGTNMILNVPVPYLIIGDPAYPLLPWLMKGYTATVHLTPEEESFNVYLNFARVCVEIAFGRLKSRWRRLLKRINVHHTFVPEVIAVCCILHNIVETRKETFLPAWEQGVNEVQAELRQPEPLRARNWDDFNAINMRDTLKDYLANNFELRRSFTPQYEKNSYLYRVESVCTEIVVRPSFS